MVPSKVRLAVWVLAMGVIAGAAHATQVIQRTPQELARESALIVDGKVASVRSYWNDEHTRILTEAMVSVASTHKGASAASIRVVQPGGVVGNVRQTAHGAVAWARGEEVLLFLEPSLPGAFQVAGFSQGKFLIERDERTGRAFIQQALPPAGDEPAARTRKQGDRVSLQQFLSDVLPSE